MDKPGVKWPEFVAKATWVPASDGLRAGFDVAFKNMASPLSIQFNDGQWEITFPDAKHTAPTPIGALKSLLVALSADLSERLAATEAVIAQCVETNVLTAKDFSDAEITLNCSCGASGNRVFNNGFIYSCTACKGPTKIKVQRVIQQEVVSP